MAITHVKSLTQADSTDTSVVHPSDWNSAHNQIFHLAGNTANVSSVSGTDVSWAGGNNITLSGTGSTISIVAGGGRQSYELVTPPGAFTTVAAQSGSFFVMPIQANGLIIDRLVAYMSCGAAASTTLGATGSASITLYGGLYSSIAGGLSLGSSASSLWSFTNNNSTTAASTLTAGFRAITIPLAATMDNQWWLGVGIRTATATAGAAVAPTLNQVVMSHMSNAAYSGLLGVASNVSNQPALALGSYSVTTSAAPASIGFSELRGANAKSLPYIVLQVSQA